MPTQSVGSARPWNGAPRRNLEMAHQTDAKRRQGRPAAAPYWRVAKGTDADAKRRISATLEWGTKAQPRNGTPDRREAEARPTGRRALLARSQGHGCRRKASDQRDLGMGHQGATSKWHTRPTRSGGKADRPPRLIGA